jgi:hypothetical protein
MAEHDFLENYPILGRHRPRQRPSPRRMAVSGQTPRIGKKPKLVVRVTIHFDFGVLV